MKNYKSFIAALGLFAFLAVPTIGFAKGKEQKITREYAQSYLKISNPAFLKYSNGYWMNIGTYDNILLFAGVETGDVKINNSKDGCLLEGNVSNVLQPQNQSLLEKTLGNADKKKPYNIIDSSEALDNQRNLCAEYKTKQEREGTLAGTTPSAINKSEISAAPLETPKVTKEPKSVEAIKQKGYTFSKDLVGEVPVEKAVRSALVPSLEVTPWKDNKGCKYKYDPNELKQIDPKTLDDFLNQISGGNLNITPEDIIPYLQGLCEKAILKNKIIKEQDIKK